MLPGVRVQYWRLSLTSRLPPSFTCWVSLPYQRTAPPESCTDSSTVTQLFVAILGTSKRTKPSASAARASEKLTPPPVTVRMTLPPAGRPRSSAERVTVCVSGPAVPVWDTSCMILPASPAVMASISSCAVKLPDEPPEAPELPELAPEPLLLTGVPLGL